MKSAILFLLAAALVLTGCGTPNSSVYTYRNALTGQGYDLITDNLIEDEEDKTSLLWLNASRLREGAWNSKYYLEAHYECASGLGWLDINPGDALRLTVDGVEMKFVGSGSLNQRVTTKAGTFVENAIYQVTENDLRKIARARAVKVSVVGTSRTVQRDMKPVNIDRFRNFVLTHIGF